jgi:hypothetical protein
MEVDLEKEPSEGEVFIYTSGGGFVVKGTLQEVTRRMSEEDWADFELAETGDKVVVRTGQVVALRAGSKPRKGSIGFLH